MVMIKVGVFWFSMLLSLDIIYDIEYYPDDNYSDEVFLTYSKQHKDVWEKLSAEQCSGKYKFFKYDALPRGRVWYDLEKKVYEIVFYRGSKDIIDMVTPKIKGLFEIENAIISVDGGLK